MTTSPLSGHTRSVPWVQSTIVANILSKPEKSTGTLLSIAVGFCLHRLPKAQGSLADALFLRLLAADRAGIFSSSPTHYTASFVKLIYCCLRNSHNAVHDVCGQDQRSVQGATSAPQGTGKTTAYTLCVDPWEQLSKCKGNDSH
jgi:hypothetical protein